MATYSFTFPTDLQYIKKASQQILDCFADLKLDERMLSDLKLCLEEALINAMKHGNKQNTSLKVNAEVSKESDSLKFTICDQGEGFDVHDLNDPTKEEHLAKTHGRGIFLIKNIMDEVRYDKENKCLHLTKRLKK